MLTKEHVCSRDRRQCVREIKCLSEREKGLNADPTCERKYGFLWSRKLSGKQHRKPDTTYMFVRDYSVVLIRLTMLQNIQTGGGFKAVIGGLTLTLKHF